MRPGEGVFRTGAIPREVADRLLSTLRRYGALCRRYHADVRAVATSALREAKNRDAIVRRARDEAGLRLEVISGMEEARLTTLGVLRGKPPPARSLCVDIGGGSTEVAAATGENPTAMWSVALGAVRLTELFGTSRGVTGKQLKLIRGFASEALTESLPARIARTPRSALGSSGTINAVVAFAAAEGTAHATARQITQAVEELAEMSPAQLRKRFDRSGQKLSAPAPSSSSRWCTTSGWSPSPPCSGASATASWWTWSGALTRRPTTTAWRTRRYSSADASNSMRRIPPR